MTSYCLLYIVPLFWILLNMAIPGSFCVSHPCVPGVAAAADYISASQQYLWLIALWNGILAQPMKSLIWSAVGSRSGDHNKINFSQSWLVLHEMFRM